MADNVSVKLFADDAKIYTVIDDVNISSNQLQHSLDLVAAWADHWQLKLSPLKCSVMCLTGNRSSSHHGPSYTIGAYCLPNVSQCTDLGVSYDNHLNFKSHVCRIVKKAAGRAKCILKCFSSRDELLLAKLHVVSERDKNVFTNRVTNIWNALPDSIITSSSVSSFKKKTLK